MALSSSSFPTPPILAFSMLAMRATAYSKRQTSASTGLPRLMAWSRLASSRSTNRSTPPMSITLRPARESTSASTAASPGKIVSSSKIPRCSPRSTLTRSSTAGSTTPTQRAGSFARRTWEKFSFRLGRRRPVKRSSSSKQLRFSPSMRSARRARSTPLPTAGSTSFLLAPRTFSTRCSASTRSMPRPKRSTSARRVAASIDPKPRGAHLCSATKASTSPSSFQSRSIRRRLSLSTRAPSARSTKPLTKVCNGPPAPSACPLMALSASLSSIPMTQLTFTQESSPASRSSRLTPRARVCITAPTQG